MKKQEMVKNNKERGAITLFVLLACLFFVFVIMGVYVSSLNKIQVQEQEISQIRENYSKELENVEEIYNELSKGMIVTISQRPEAGIWTNQVTLTGKAEVRKEGTTIVKYAFSKDTTDESGLTWETVDSEAKIEKTTKVTENGKYYFWVQDSEGNIEKSSELEINNIDKNAPTAGTIIAKTENKDGEDYTLDTWTDKSIYIEKVNGTDEESGHKQTTITILKNGLPVEEWTNIEGPITIEQSGIYTITVTTQDNAGNTATSESYIVKIDKVVPVLTLKHNDTTGEEYENGTWTKDDLYGEITIDDKTGKTVDRYQYSENGITWYDISGIPAAKELDYTTTFPMGEGKPEWISGPTNNHTTYYFQVQEDGTLKPNNSGKNSSTANSYFEIDLTDYPDAELEITINATISSESNWDFGYATITENTTAPTFNKSNTYYIKVSGATTTADHTTTITGGKKYYLHIAYSKDSSSSKNQDTFIINSIILKTDGLAKGMNFVDYIKTENKVSFKLNEEIEKDIYIRAVYTEENSYSKYGDKTSIKIDKKAPIFERVEDVILSKTEAKLNVTVAENESGLKGYYISTEETAPTEEKEWIEQILKEFTIEGLSTNTTYYIWLIDNAGNISEKQEVVIGKANYEIDGSMCTETLSEAITKASDSSTIKLLNDYTDTIAATFDKNITLDVQQFTLTRNKTITINSGKTVEITGTGKLTTQTTSVNTITNNGKLTLSNNITVENNSTSSSYAPIYSNSTSAITNINDNVKIKGYYRGIYNYFGTVNVNGGYIEATYSNSSAYGIYMYYSSAKTYIYGGEVKGYTGVYINNSSGIMQMTGGKVVGTGSYGVYAKGTANIYGGRVEGKTYGVYGYSSNKVTVGKQEDELSTTSPAIYGETYGIYMYNETYSFNFYNGVIISNTENTAYRGVANLRENHMTYTYIDYEVEQKYCTILTPIVENIIMQAQPTEFTNGNVKVRIIYPLIEGETKLYSEDGIEWKETEGYVQDVVIYENKIIYARTLNESGIITDENQIEVNNIDKEKPIVTITPTKTIYSVREENETKDIILTINATDVGVSGLDVMQYAWAREGDEITYTNFTNEKTISKTNLGIGTYYLYINVTDKAGNKAELEQIRYNIQLQEPVAQIGETKYLTIQEAVEACSKDAVREEIVDVEYSTNFPIKGEISKVITGPFDNGGYYFKVQSDGTLKPNNSGINSTTANSYFEIDLTEYTETEVEIDLTINATISSQASDYGYATITKNTTAPSYGSTNGRFIYVSGATTTANHTTTLTGGNKYYLHIGYYKNYYTHSYDDTFIINSINITGKMPGKVSDAATTINILKSTDEEFSTYEGQNIILDLKGYTVGNANIGATTCTNNGILQIIDTSTEKTGKLENLNGITIENTSVGTIIIGDNNTSIQPNVPTIYGKKIGIKNEGTFNFYDGKIQGVTPIHGQTTDTPNGFGPVSTDYSNGITTVQLGIVSGYEARIEWIYYATVQEAIEATKHYYDNSRDTVTIIKDIELRSVLELDVTKKFVLDLNSYKITAITDSSIINNYGDMKITDSSSEQTGTLEVEKAAITYGINNYGNLEIAGGTISSISSNNTSYGIYSNGEGNVIVTGGTVSSDSTSDNSGNSYGIYNNGKGNIKIIGGNVSSRISSSHVQSRRAAGITNNSTGSVLFEGGIINCNSSGDYNDCYGIDNSGSMKVTGGMIKSNAAGSWADSSGIFNLGSVTIIGGTISESDYGITNSGNVTMIGGMISSSIGGSYGISNSGDAIIVGGTIDVYSTGISNGDEATLIIGLKEENISQENPVIKSKQVTGLSNSLGNVEFYSGIIQGRTNATTGSITKVRENYHIENSVINGLDSIYLIENANTESVVKIGDTEFYNLAEAIESIQNDDETTIEVLRDFELSEAIDFNKNIILDLKGYTITNKYYPVKNTKILKITDTSEGQQGKIENKISTSIMHEGESLQIDAGTISSTEYGIYNRGTGSITITGGTIYTKSSGKSFGIYNEGIGSVIIIGGVIDSNGSNTTYGIYNTNKGTLEINGGTIISYSSSYYAYGITNVEGNVIITGGTIDCDSVSTSATGHGYGISNGTGSIRITGGIIDAYSGLYAYGIYNGTGNVEIAEKTTVNCISNGAYSYGIYNSSTGSITVTKGTITSNAGSNYGYGIYNNSTGSITVTGGTISNTSAGRSSYGIYNYKTGIITIGTKGDGLVSQEEPNIKGEYTGTSTSYVGYGIYNTSSTSLYFYDGIIEGTTKAVYNIITEREENTELNYNENETILTLSSEIPDIAQIGETTYKTLEEAINAVGSEKTTITVLRNATFTSQDTVVTIPNTKDIILNLNGYKIVSAIPESLIQNEGILEIIDTSEEQSGILKSTTEKTINNISGAKLVLSSGTIENVDKYPIYNEGNVIVNGGTITSCEYGIYNIGSVEVSGGSIDIYESTMYFDEENYGIYNKNSGTIKITGGTISAYGDVSHGIYNNSTGNIQVTGGEIIGECIPHHSGNVGYGIYNVSTGGIEVTEGNISGSTYGIYNNSTATITIGIKGDGIVSQETPVIGEVYNTNGYLNFYDGKISGDPRAITGRITEVEENTELAGSRKTVTLQLKETNAVSVNGVEYKSVQKAVNACGNIENTIKLLRDVDPAESIIIGEQQNITLDLNGYTETNYQEITNKGILKITDTSEAQTGKVIGLAETAILNKGTMELNSGTIANSVYGIYNSHNSNTILTVTGGIISNNTYGIYNENHGIIEIIGGTIKSNTYGVYNYYNGENKITGGTITSNTYGIYNYKYYAKNNITGGNITLNEYGIYNAEQGTTNISSTGISNNTYGVYNTIEGKIIIKEGSQIQSDTGIYNSGATVNIGESGTMNVDSPIIIGEKYGLVNVNSTSAIVYMYDGQIKGKTGATQGYITYTETGYTVANKVDGEYYVNYLALAGTISTVAEVNGISFSNLQSAINSVIGEEAQTIKLTNGISESGSYTIGEEQKIIIDMNGKTITSDQEVTITNNGTLTIVDTSGKNVAKISNTVGTAIINNGTLSLGENDGTVNPDLINIDGTTYGIENSGTLNFYDGTINGASAVNGTITTRADGYVTRTTTVDSKERYYLTT